MLVLGLQGDGNIIGKADCQGDQLHRHTNLLNQVIFFIFFGFSYLLHLFSKIFVCCTLQMDCPPSVKKKKCYCAELKKQLPFLLARKRAAQLENRKRHERMQGFCREKKHTHTLLLM